MLVMILALTLLPVNSFLPCPPRSRPPPRNRIPGPGRKSSLGPADLPQIVQGAGDSLSALLEHMRINHGRRHIGVPQQLLNCPNVRALLQQVRRKTMAETVRAHYLRQTG